MVGSQAVLEEGWGYGVDACFDEKLLLEMAKDVDLAGYLRSCGFHLEAKGKRNWRLPGHTGLLIHRNHWRESKPGGRGRSGNSLDFLVTVMGLNPITAAQELLDQDDAFRNIPEACGCEESVTAMAGPDICVWTVCCFELRRSGISKTSGGTEELPKR